MLIVALSNVNAGIVTSPFSYTVPTHAHLHAAPLSVHPYHYARSAPFIAAPSVVASPYIKAAPLISAPVVKTIVPHHQPIVAAKTIYPVAAPVIKTVDNDAHPQYAFAYNVDDALTGDSKSQEEVRDGDIVKGYYRVLDADGTTRKVSYYADPINGKVLNLLKNLIRF